jgi:hypothetical protein
LFKKSVLIDLKVIEEHTISSVRGREWLARGLTTAEADRLFDAPMSTEMEVVTQWGNTIVDISTDEDSCSATQLVVDEDLSEGEVTSDPDHRPTTDDDDDQADMDDRSTSPVLPPSGIKVCFIGV